MPQRNFVAISSQDAELKPMPVNPSWVLEGAPQARSVEIARSADGASNTMIWDCTRGKFRWFFGVDETVHILEGEVAVSNDFGHRRVLRAGDIAFFPAGTWMTWEVNDYVRKVAFLRHAMPRPMGFALRAMNFAINLVRGRKPERPRAA